MIVKNHESESGHWYTKLGEPAYRIIGTNGVERNTTIKDARKHQLVPSVTTITNQLKSIGLERWQQGNLLLAALTLPKQENESEDSWIDRVVQDGKSIGKEAAERGTRMHGVLESFYRRQEVAIYPLYVIEVDRVITEHFGAQQWAAEASFASPLGYGGKIDLNGSEVVIDFKSKTGSLDKVTVYHEQVMQLAAYRYGLNMPNARCANVFFTEAGEVKLVEHSEDALASAWDCFKCRCSFTKLRIICKRS
jgi:hypothetical protein